MNLVRTAIRRPVTVSMFVVAVILFGLVSLDRLALNLLPDISYPSLTIQTDYEDAAPEEVESLITRPIEEAVGVISGLRRLSSVSRSGRSEVVLEFSWDTQMDFAGLDAREKLDVVTLPRDTEKPVILRFDPSYDPILRLQLYGDMSLRRLRYLAEKELKKSLESTEGVAAIKVIGGLEEQVRIEIDEKRLGELQIPITEVTRVLTEENLNQAAGSLYDLDANYLVRMLNQFRSMEEIKGIIIQDQDGRKVVLGEVAKVWRGTKDREVIARLNGQESVEMGVYKEGDANTVTVARAVERKLETLKQSELYPKGLEYQIVFNQADFIQLAVNNVLWAAFLGGLLATLVLYIFLRDLRSTLTIAFSIPIAIMATFALMYQTDITLNIMSLGGIALGVGMLVDNSIVVLESVHRHKKPGVLVSEAVYQGTREVGKAVTASTLTTVAVFLPLIFVEGIAGQLFKDQALTITYALLASLLVALTFIPMVLALRMSPREVGAGEGNSPPLEGTPPPKEEKDRQGVPSFLARNVRRAVQFIFADLATIVLTDVRRLFRAAGNGTLRIVNPLLTRWEAGYQALSRSYPSHLNWSLDHKGSITGGAGVLVIVAVLLSLQLGAELIPPFNQGEFAFEIKLSEGQPLRETDRLLGNLERRVATYAEVRTVFSRAGGSQKNQFVRDMSEEHVGQLYVVMKDRKDQDAERRVMERIRAALGEYPEAVFTVSRPTLFSFKTPIEVEIYSFDLSILRDTARKVAARLEQIPGLSDVQTSTKLGTPEIQIRFDRERLARLGLEENAIAKVLRNKIRGEVASRYRREDKQIDILVRADESHRNNIQDIRNLVVGWGTSTVSLPRENSNSRPLSRPQSEPETSPSRRTQNGREPSQEPEAWEQKVPIRLGAVADVVIDRGPSEVRRIRLQRAAVVSANLTGRDLNSVSEEIRAELQDLRGEISSQTTLTLGGQNEELGASYKSLLLALVLAVFLVYLVMASQFESFLHPFIIMFTVPFGVVGVILALFLTGTTVSVMVFLGVIILAGIVVNNAIVLIDLTNQLRRQGLSQREALLQAGQVRLRPILMTTLTTVLGLIPMGLGWGEGAEIRAPMAIAVMGGLLFSTLLTLIFIPVVYELVDRKTYLAVEAVAES